MHKILLLSLLFIVFPALAAKQTVYTYTDSNENIAYTNTASAKVFSTKQIKVTPLQKLGTEPTCPYARKRLRNK